jgi:hypothetical protein
MWTPRKARIVSILIPWFLAVLAAAPVCAQNTGTRIRAESRYLRLVIASGIELSTTFREIVDQLEESDLIVEVRCSQFRASTLAGRTALLSAQPAVRYVLVEVNCPVTSLPALCTIGHELRHALEIASARSVVDSESLALLYTQIGFLTQGKNSNGQFETADALEAGGRIHHELLHQEDFTRRRLAQAFTK